MNANFQEIINREARLLMVQKLSPEWQPLKQQLKVDLLPTYVHREDEVVYWEANKALRHIDTITVRFPCTLKDPTAGDLLEDRSFNRGKKRIGKYQNLLKMPWKGASVFVQYLPSARENVGDFIKITFSVQKLTLGNNFQLIPAGFDIIAVVNSNLALINNTLGIPSTDFAYCEVRRIDACYNFRVGGNVNYYLAYAKTQSYARRERADYNNKRSRPAGFDPMNNGTCFYSDSVRTSVYSKEEECKNLLAAGLFRLETSFRRFNAVQQQFFGKKAPRVIDLTHDIIQKVLQKDLVILRLNHPIQTKKTIYDVLVEAVGSKRASKLIGFVFFEMQNPGLSSKEAASKFGCTVKTINQKRQILRETGISYWGDEELILPPLVLDIFDEQGLQAANIVSSEEETAERGEKGAEVTQYICSDPWDVDDFMSSGGTIVYDDDDYAVSETEIQPLERVVTISGAEARATNTPYSIGNISLSQIQPVGAREQLAKGSQFLLLVHKDDAGGW